MNCAEHMYNTYSTYVHMLYYSIVNGLFFCLWSTDTVSTLLGHLAKHSHTHIHTHTHCVYNVCTCIVCGVLCL